MISNITSRGGFFQEKFRPEATFFQMTYDTLGKRLKFFAKQRYGSLRKFGEAIGMGSSQLSSYTTGESKPETETLERFASTGMNIHWLLTGEGSMDAPKQVDTEKRSGSGGIIHRGRFTDEEWLRLRDVWEAASREKHREDEKEKG